MKLHALMVLNDGETWTELTGSSIVIVTDDALESLMNGTDDIKTVEVLSEISFTEY